MRLYFIFFLSSVLLSSVVQAREPLSKDPEFDEILSQDISGLTVTSVGKRSQQLKDTAAAVYVITQEDLRRAGVYSIPEALRLVPGMQVAKASSNRWAVSARGFNGTLANKLLVLIDGRAIYTPVFSGVYWDDQSTSINDIERIEVIRGPGASLYGANAVNGVVNIITKSAEETQGNLLSATTTANGRGIYEARHGRKLSNNDYYRAYSQYQDSDSWYRGRAGFRMDGKVNGNDTYTFQGDAYGGQQDATLRTATLTAPYIQDLKSTDDSHGGNLLTRWNRKISNASEVSVQAYIDNYSRNEWNFNQNVSTADIQAQHSIRLTDRDNFIWGGGARLYYENLEGTFYAITNDRYSAHDTLNVFAQDEHSLIEDVLFLTIGSKFEYNDFTGFEVQPSTRLAWHFSDSQMVWGAISRAVRTPSSIEEDVSVLAAVNPTTTPFTELRIVGNPQQESEELVAYELGHRIELSRKLSFDTALFYNDFTNLQTLSTPGASFTGNDGNTVIPYNFNNLGSGHVYGLETSANWNVSNRWKLSGSYSYLKMNLDVKPGTAVSLESTEEMAPRNQFSIQSYYNVSEAVHWDNIVYYVDHISKPIGSYVRYDTRLAWLLHPGLEVSVIGRNLLGAHDEFPSTPQTEIGRNLIGQVLWKF